MDKEQLIKRALSPNAKIISPLVGGMMNESYVVESDNVKYVLYIPTKQANEMVDRKLEKEVQSIFFDLNITSKNMFFDTTTGVKINQYIEGESLDKVKEYDVKKVAELFLKMHSSNKKASKDYDPFKRFPGYEKEALSFVKTFDEEYIKVRNLLFNNMIFLNSQEKVLAHNDSQKSNIIKGKDGKYYIIDFEFAMNNDPIYDIAAFGNGDVMEGYDLLKATYKELTKDIQSRYFLWRIYLSLQWYNVALVKHYRGEGKIHGFNFLDVATHFKNNALTAYKKYLDIN